MATENIHTLENPIDVIPLIHKAFRAVSTGPKRWPPKRRPLMTYLH